MQFDKIFLAPDGEKNGINIVRKVIYLIHYHGRSVAKVNEKVEREIMENCMLKREFREELRTDSCNWR